MAVIDATRLPAHRPDPHEPADTSVEARVRAALLACIARYGLAKTTLDDVAREAGCSRATVYRYFDGKADLVRRTATAEIAAVTGRVVAAAEGAATLPDAVVAVVVDAARELRGHVALRFLLAHEPEAVLPHLAFAPGDEILTRVGDLLAPALARWLAPADATRSGDWLARVLRSYVLMPEPTVDLTHADTARAFLEQLVIPGIGSPRPAQGR
jgi:AcrR family transcriptional regulator